MNMQRIRSNNIVNAAGYDPDTQTLDVEFNGGEITSFSGVDKERFERLLAAANDPDKIEMALASIRRGATSAQKVLTPLQQLPVNERLAESALINSFGERGTALRTEHDKQKSNDARARRLANLKPFKPGQSGNPAGRPKSITLSEAYRKQLAMTDETDPQKRTHAEVLAEQMIARARTGDVTALKELADRTEGKARQTITLTSERREQIEQAIDRMIERAASDGQSLTREEATGALAAYVPEASQLIH